MKNLTFTFKDFELETISKKELKTIKGGGNDSQTPINPPVDPSKAGGGAGNT